MKNSLVIALALIAISGCSSHHTGAISLLSVRLTGHDQGGDEVAVENEGHRTVVDVHSRAGIGGAELTPSHGEWRHPVVMRFHLHGLEALQLSNGKLAIHTSVLSSPPYTQLCELLPVGGRNGTPLEQSSPYWIRLHVVNNKEPGQRVVPLEDGYFELTVPHSLLDENPKMLSIHWIDFLRR